MNLSELSSRTQTKAEYDRIMSALGIKTQVELAECINSKQPSISDALLRGKSAGVPANWKLALLKKYGLSPMWVETGMGDMYLGSPQGGIPEKAPLQYYSSAELMAELCKRIPGFGKIIAEAATAGDEACHVA